MRLILRVDERLRYFRLCSVSFLYDLTDGRIIDVLNHPLIEIDLLCT